MKVRYWGVRSQVATPGPDYVRIGGNTPCLEIRNEADQLLVLDAGTGMPGLGGHLFATGMVKPDARINVILSDTRWDHTQGFPFFGPGYVPDVHLHWYGLAENEDDLRNSLAGAMTYSYFPIRLDELRSNQNFHLVGEESEELELDGFRIRCMKLNCTHLSLAWRIEADGRALVHVPGWELPVNGSRDIRRELTAFSRGADLLIHDAYYLRRADQVWGWGHSSLESGVDLALHAGIGRLVASGWRPGDSDGKIDEAARSVSDELSKAGRRLDLVCAREGETTAV